MQPGTLLKINGIPLKEASIADLGKLKEFYEEDRIKFHGKLDQEQVIKLYYEYSVFILPSYREGLSRSIEAGLFLSDPPAIPIKTLSP